MRRAVVVFTIVLAAVDGGCYRNAVQRALPVEPHEEYCWWHVMTSPLSVDTVAARFASAFATIGFRNVRWEHQGDTAWAVSTPTLLRGQPEGVLYASRIVGYQKGDSTHFRSYVMIQPAGDGAVSTTAIAGEATGVIGLCRAIATAAAVQATARPEATGEEAWRLWARSQ